MATREELMARLTGSQTTKRQELLDRLNNTEKQTTETPSASAYAQQTKEKAATVEQPKFYADFITRQTMDEKIAEDLAKPTENPYDTASAGIMSKLTGGLFFNRGNVSREETQEYAAQQAEAEKKKEAISAYRKAALKVPFAKFTGTTEEATQDAVEKFAAAYPYMATTDKLVKAGVSGLVNAVKGGVNYIGDQAQILARQRATDAALDLQAAERLGLADQQTVDETAAYARELEEQPIRQAVKWGEKLGQQVDEETENLTGAGKAASQIAQGIGGMVPNIALNTVAPGSGLGMSALFMNAAGNAAQEARDKGASDEAALLYGNAVGAVEVLTETVFGGVPGLGEGWADTMTEGWAKKIASNAFTETALNTLFGAVGEGLEEWMSEFADAGLNKLIVKQDDRSLGDISRDAAYSFTIGALTSAVMQSVSIPGKITDAKAVRQIAEQTAENAQKYFGGMNAEEAAKKYAEYKKAGLPAAEMEKVEQGYSIFNALPEDSEASLPEITQETAQETTQETAESTAEDISLPTPAEYVTRSEIDRIIRNPAELAAMGIETNGKTNSQLRAEVRAKLNGETAAEQTATETAEAAEETAAETAEAVAEPEEVNAEEPAEKETDFPEAARFFRAQDYADETIPKAQTVETQPEQTEAEELVPETYRERVNRVRSELDELIAALKNNHDDSYVYKMVLEAYEAKKAEYDRLTTLKEKKYEARQNRIAKYKSKKEQITEAMTKHNERLGEIELQRKEITKRLETATGAARDVLENRRQKLDSEKAYLEKQIEKGEENIRRMEEKEARDKQQDEADFWEYGDLRTWDEKNLDGMEYDRTHQEERNKIMEETDPQKREDMWVEYDKKRKEYRDRYDNPRRKATPAKQTETAAEQTVTETPQTATEAPQAAAETPQTTTEAAQELQTENVTEQVETPAEGQEMTTEEQEAPAEGQETPAEATQETAEQEMPAETERAAEPQETPAEAEKGREQYAASPALEKLGVKIDTPIANTVGAEQDVSYQKAKKIAEKAWNEAKKRLRPSEAEIQLAMDIGSGILTEGDAKIAEGSVFKDVSWKKVRELADYYMAKDSFRQNRLAETKQRSQRTEQEIAYKLTADSDTYKAVPMLRLYGNTMERDILMTAGEKSGKKINERYFSPIMRNSAEKERFINRMLDRVRDFKLTKAESQMVMRLMEGNAANAEVLKMGDEARERVKAAAKSEDIDLEAADYGLTYEERQAAKAYKGYLETIADMEGMDSEKINAAVKAYTEAYDDFYAAINEMLVSHGYDTIGFIKGYAPHMQTGDAQTALQSFLDIFGLEAEVTTLPTEIAGRTENYKPGKQWDPYFQHRNSKKELRAEQYDAVAGYESYVHYMANVLYHTDDIQKLRVLSNALRLKYSDEELSNRISQAQNLRAAPIEVKKDLLMEDYVQEKLGDLALEDGETLTDEKANALMDLYIEKLYGDISENTKMGNLVSIIDDYANKLAGKQTKLDRSIESTVGRKALNIGNAMSRLFGQSSVVGNLSSAFAQVSQLPFAQAELGNKYMIRAMRDLFKGETKGMELESDYLTGKEGVDSLLAERSWKDSTHRQRMDKVNSALSIPFEAVDMAASKLIVRAKYLQAVEEGYSAKEAMRLADEYAAKIVGNRIQGGRPMIFESKNIISKVLTTYQLEIANAWSHISQDLPAKIKSIAKEQGKTAAVKYTASLLTRYSLEAFLLNRLAETVYGGTPAAFDIIGYILGGVAAGRGETVNGMLLNAIAKVFGLKDDEDKDKEFDVSAAIEETKDLVVGDLPYVRNFASLAGYGDSNLPLPTIPVKTHNSLWELIKGEGSWGEVGYNALKELPTWLPAGSQIKKTVQGLQTVANQGRYTANGELMYPFDTSGALGKLKAAKAILFGTGALDAQDAYYAAENRKLSEDQTAMFEEVTEGEDPNTVYDLIMELRGIKDVADSDEDAKAKRDLLRMSDISDTSKLAVYSTMIGDSKDEAFAELMERGLDFDALMDIMDAYYDVEYSGGSASEKATAFAKWADETFPEQADAIKENMKFWQIIPASAGSYETFHAAGLSASASETANNALQALEPEEGKSTVSDWQKYSAITSADLTDKEKQTALTAIMEDNRATTLTNAVKRGVPVDEAVKGIEISAKTEGTKDTEGNTISGSKALNVQKEIDKLDMNKTKKKALYASLGYNAINMWDSKYSGDNFEAYYYMSDASRESYTEYAAGFYSPYQYKLFADKVNGFTADKKADGTTISGSKKAKIVSYIDSLKLTDDQKTALYAAAGQSKSTVSDCPWWSAYALRSGDYPW